MAKTPKYTGSKGSNSYKKKNGWESLYLTLERLESDTTRTARAQLASEAKKVAKMAKKMAPVDEYNLEDAITFQSVGQGAYGKQGTDSSGRFNKNAWTIGVDINAMAGNKRVGDYAVLVHEYLPWGTTEKWPMPGTNKLWGLGPKSLAKQATSGVEVGGAFMYRAMEEINGSGLIKRRVVEAIEKTIDKFVIMKKQKRF